MIFFSPQSDGWSLYLFYNLFIDPFIIQRINKYSKDRTIIIFLLNFIIIMLLVVFFKKFIPFSIHVKHSYVIPALWFLLVLIIKVAIFKLHKNLIYILFFLLISFYILNGVTTFNFGYNEQISISENDIKQMELYLSSSYNYVYPYIYYNNIVYHAHLVPFFLNFIRRSWLLKDKNYLIIEVENKQYLIFNLDNNEFNYAEDLVKNNE